MEDERSTQVLLRQALAIAEGQSSVEPRRYHIRALASRLRDLQRELLNLTSRRLDYDETAGDVHMSNEPKKDVQPKDTNTDTLNDLVTLVVDTFNDTEHFIKGASQSPIAAFSNFSNLIQDVMRLIPELGHLPSEIKQLDTEAVERIVSDIASRLDIENAKAKEILQAAVEVFNDLAEHVVGDMKKLFDAVKDKAPTNGDTANEQK